MAARVNTKFVIILVASLLGATAAAGGSYWYIARKNPEKLIARAKLASENGQWVVAAESYRKALRRRPNRVDLIYDFVDTIRKIELKEMAQAQIYVQQMVGFSHYALTLRPSDEQAFQRFADLVTDLVREQGMRSTWSTLYQAADHAVNEYPEMTIARKYRGISRVNRLADTEVSELEGKQIEEDLEVAIEAYPSDKDLLFFASKWYHSRAVLHEKPGRDHEQAILLREKAVKLAEKLRQAHPQDTEALVFYSRILVLLGQAEKARPIVDGLEAKLLQTPVSNHLVMRVQDLLFAVDQDRIETPEGGITYSGLNRAQNLLRVAVKANPDNIQLRNALGTLLVRTSQSELALEVFQEASLTAIANTPIKAVADSFHRRIATAQYADLRLNQLSEVRDREEREKVLGEIKVIIDDLDKHARGLGGWTDMLRGKVHELESDHLQAAIAYDKSLEQLQDSFLILQALERSAAMHYLSQQTGTALARYQAILAIQPTNKQVRYTMVQLLIGQQTIQSLAEAQIHVTQLMGEAVDGEVAPADLPTLILQANLYRAQEKTEQSIALYRKLMKVDSATTNQHRVIANALARLLASNDSKEEAVQLLSSELELNPGDRRLLGSLSRFVDADSAKVLEYHLDKGIDAGLESGIADRIRKRMKLRQTPATEESVEARIKEVEDPFRRNMAFFGFYRTANRMDEAYAALEEATKIDSAHSEVIRAQFSRALLDEDWDGAEKWVGQARDNNADLAGGMFYVGRLDHAKGEYRRAISSFMQALDARPNFDEGWRRLGEAQRLNGELEAALQSFARALEQNPGNLQSVVGKARSHEALGQYTAGLELLRRTRKQLTKTGGTTLETAYLHYEQNYGDKQIALQERRKIAEKNPQYTRNRRDLAHLEAELGNNDEALAVIDSLIDEEGLTLVTAMTKAQVMVQLDQTDAGYELIRKYVLEQGEQATMIDWLLLGRFCWQTGKMDEGYEAFNHAKKLEDPNIRPATYEMAQWLSTVGKFGQAAQLLDSWWADGEADPRVGMSLAGLWLQAGKPDNAAAVLAQLPADNAENPQIYSLKGRLATARNKPVEAEGYLDKAIEGEPDNAAFYYQRAMAKISSSRIITGDAVVAIRADLEQALKLNPQFTAARRQLARHYLRTNRADAAVVECRTLLKHANRSRQDRLLLAGILMATKDWLQLNDLLAETSEMFPKDSIWHRFKGDSLMQQRPSREEEAIAAYKVAFEIDVDRQNMQTLATLYVKRGEADKTLSIIRAHPKLARDQPVIQAVRGRALAVTRRNEEAASAFRIAIGLCKKMSQLEVVTNHLRVAFGPKKGLEFLLAETAGLSDKPWAELVVAKYEMAVGLKKEARDRYMAVESRIGPDSPYRMDIELGLARLNDVLGDNVQAAVHYKWILKRTPDNVAMLNNFAYMLAEEMDDPQSALPYAQHAAALAPNDGAVLDTYGWIQLKVGKPREALETLERARLNSQMAEGYYHLGMVYVELAKGDRGSLYLRQARQTLQKAAEVAEKEGRKKILNIIRQQLEELAQG